MFRISSQSPRTDVNANKNKLQKEHSTRPLASNDYQKGNKRSGMWRRTLVMCVRNHYFTKVKMQK